MKEREIERVRENESLRERGRGVSMWRGVSQLCDRYMQPTRSQSVQLPGKAIEREAGEREQLGLTPAPLCAN